MVNVFGLGSRPPDFWHIICYRRSRSAAKPVALTFCKSYDSATVNLVRAVSVLVFDFQSLSAWKCVFSDLQGQDDVLPGFSIVLFFFIHENGFLSILTPKCRIIQMISDCRLKKTLCGSAIMQLGYKNIAILLSQRLSLPLPYRNCS